MVIRGGVIIVPDNDIIPNRLKVWHLALMGDAEQGSEYITDMITLELDGLQIMNYFLLEKSKDSKPYDIKSTGARLTKTGARIG